MDRNEAEPYENVADSAPSSDRALHSICQDKPIIFSFFSGAGFLDLGFEKAGFQIGYVNEVHKPFLQAYKYSRQKMGISQPTFGYFDGSIEDCLSN